MTFEQDFPEFFIIRNDGNKIDLVEEQCLDNDSVKWKDLIQESCLSTQRVKEAIVRQRNILLKLDVPKSHKDVANEPLNWIEKELGL